MAFLLRALSDEADEDDVDVELDDELMPPPLISRLVRPLAETGSCGMRNSMSTVEVGSGWYTGGGGCLVVVFAGVEVNLVTRSGSASSARVRRK